jgi:cytidine deaminase
LNDDVRLLEQAVAASARAHSPYSKIRVGAAARDASGKVFTGCNIENASLGLTVCAERVALWNAVAQGADRITVLALASNHPAVTTPCGACRQVILELAPDARIVFGDGAGASRSWATVRDLLPDAFDPTWME